MMRLGTRKVDVAPIRTKFLLMYSLVLKQCALERDLTLFDVGDQTEVGEKGVTLR